MNYRHLYHAGNFCDVVKHCILVSLLQSFAEKDKPYCYIDTHAGTGLYDLESDESTKSGEWQEGIAKILAETSAIPQLVADYVACIRQCNYSDGPITQYPGSAYLAKQLMSFNDSIMLNELHPEDAHLLKNTFASDPRIAIHQQDAYQILKALLPPAIKRGLILIDPPYEHPKEFEKIVAALPLALKRFSTGCYAIWYPIKDKRAVKKFLDHIKALNLPNVLDIQLNILPEDSRFQLNGTGMLIINPPWQVEQKLEPVLAWLWQKLSINGQGSYKLEKL
ncbi:MAG: 23S rRNA (adenine(2030)-N(6))-methyltransferase RlmJ [Gammaproteobacteria bacterium]|nr:23S rRNA (adenine(2030)-N(6))-methyltransferase RlmJ [Gammaproteobacteria bacterium]